MKTKQTKEENRVQAEAFRRMHGNVLELIDRYAPDFRSIIVDFEAARDGQIPSADDLLWIESERLGYDVTKAA